MIPQIVVPAVPAKQPVIEFLIENGFSIFRLSEIDRSIPRTGPTHEFLVRDPNGYELNITVQIAQRAFDEIWTRCRGRITNESPYWIALAERHLAGYLAAHDDYPADALLRVENLTLNDLDLARRWDCSE